MNISRRAFLSLSTLLLANQAIAREEPPAPTRELFALWGASPKSVFAVGYTSGAIGLILHSQDQGKTWSQPKSQSTQKLYAIWGSNKTIFVVGASGTILRSVDQGKSWERMTSGTKRALYAIGGLSAKELVVIGEAGTILHTKDSGKTWAALTSPTAQSLSSIWVEGKKSLYIGGVGGTLLYSSDGGSTWSAQKSPAKEKIVALQSQKGTELLLVDSSQIYQSTDSGSTWSSNPSTEKLFGLFVLSESLWLIPGAKGVVYSSLDQGASWSDKKSGLRGSLRSIWGADKELYAVSEHGGIAYSSDAGLTWAVILKETLQGRF